MVHILPTSRPNTMAGKSARLKSTSTPPPCEYRTRPAAGSEGILPSAVPLASLCIIADSQRPWTRMEKKATQ
ncbi:MAG TPA: hypothetical protein VGE29_03960 [Prosthecobacter sp.]